jgi:hypothetical protein
MPPGWETTKPRRYRTNPARQGSGTARALAWQRWSACLLGAAGRPPHHPSPEQLRPVRLAAPVRQSSGWIAKAARTLRPRRCSTVAASSSTGNDSRLTPRSASSAATYAGSSASWPSTARGSAVSLEVVHTAAWDDRAPLVDRRKRRLSLQSLHEYLLFPCEQMAQSLHEFLFFPCEQMPLPPHSLHVLLILPCGQMALPPHSLHVAFRLP